MEHTENNFKSRALILTVLNPQSLSGNCDVTINSLISMNLDFLNTIWCFLWPLWRQKFLFFAR